MSIVAWTTLICANWYMNYTPELVPWSDSDRDTCFIIYDPFRSSSYIAWFDDIEDKEA